MPPNDRSKAAPSPGLRELAQPGSNRITGDVRRSHTDLSVVLHQDGAIPPLEDMANAVVAGVEPLRISTVQTPHSFTEIRLGRLDQKVRMVVHQAVRQGGPSQSTTHCLKTLQIEAAVDVIEINRRSVIPPSENVIDGARFVVARLPGHSLSSTPAGAIAPPRRSRSTARI
jgi:hypothetical protein